MSTSVKTDGRSPGAPESCRHGSLFQIWFSFASGMPTNTLKTGIEALINAIGGSEPPDFGHIKGKLMKLVSAAEALEKGEATREAEAKIAALEAALEQATATLEQAHTDREHSNAENDILRPNWRRRMPRWQRFWKARHSPAEYLADRGLL